MVATQPTFSVVFKELAVTAIQRLQRNTIVMVLDDDTNPDVDKITYRTLGDVVKADYTEVNYELLTLAFMGNPLKVVVVKAEEEWTDTQKKLDYFDNYTLVYPGAGSDIHTQIINYIKSVRGKNNYSKVILANATAPDAEYVINFVGTGIQANIGGNVKTFSTGDYTARVAGALGGLATSRSLTYYELPEIVECTLPEDADADVANGKLDIIFVDGAFKLGRAVNSLTTLTDGVTEAFQKIRVLDIMDLIANDIISTFRRSYVGKYTNNLSNKKRFIGAINSYLLDLANEGLLESANQNAVELSYEKTKAYLKGKGVDVDKMTYDEIISANTGSKVLLDGVCSPTDTMEDLDLGMYLFQSLDAE